MIEYKSVAGLPAPYVIVIVTELAENESPVSVLNLVQRKAKDLFC